MKNQNQNSEPAPEPVDKRRTVTTQQAAEMLGCSPSHVRTLIKNGRIEAVKIVSVVNPVGYNLHAIRDSVKAYKKLVPRRGWPRGVSRK